MTTLAQCLQSEITWTGQLMAATLSSMPTYQPTYHARPVPTLFAAPVHTSCMANRLGTAVNCTSY
jgi:hypothetical protein